MEKVPARVRGPEPRNLSAIFWEHYKTTQRHLSRVGKDTLSHIVILKVRKYQQWEAGCR